MLGHFFYLISSSSRSKPRCSGLAMLCFLQFLYLFDRKAKRNRDDSDRNAILLKCFCIIIALL